MKECPICKEKCSNTGLKQHLLKVHKVNKIDLLLYLAKENKSLQHFKKIPVQIVKAYLIKLQELNGLTKRYDSQFFASYKQISYVRPFDVEKDIDLFFNKILPWKLKHPSVVNCKDLCYLEAPDNEEDANKIYQHFMLEKNPYYKHDGKLSPWSKEFVGYKHMTDEEKKVAIRKANKSDTREYNTKISYYLHKGYTLEEAEEKRHKRQQTFSLERCISKYGKEKGYEIWKKRQEKWQKTINSKSDEELIEINRKKVNVFPGNHKETEFLMSILPDTHYHNVYIKGIAIGDLVYGKKIIEFYGDYWHCNPLFWEENDLNKTLKMTAKEKWTVDKERANKLISLGYEIKIVWEHDYMFNRKEVIKECKNFLGVK